MSYCRKHFLNRTALITIEVTTSSHILGSETQPLILLSWHFHYLPGRQTRADEDDGTGRLLISSLFQVSGAAPAAVQAAHLGAERGADGRPVRQHCPGPVHALRGRAREGGVHGGDASRQSSGAPVVRQPTPADAWMASVPGEGTESGLGRMYMQSVFWFYSDCWRLMHRWGTPRSTCETPRWSHLSRCCCLEETLIFNTGRDS